MNSTFETFRQYTSPVAAEPLLEILRGHGIPYQTAQLNPAGLAALNNHHETLRLVGVQIRRQDFERARTAVADHYQHLTDSADPDHYLFAFSDEELMDVVVKPDEWSDFDYALAQRLLRERGRDVSPAVVELLQQRRDAELNRPEETQTAWIAAGYAFALLGGVVGLFIGWHLYRHRRTLPDGRQVHAFSPRDRVHGLRILGLGAVMVLASVALRVYSGA